MSAAARLTLGALAATALGGAELVWLLSPATCAVVAAVLVAMVVSVWTWRRRRQQRVEAPGLRGLVAANYAAQLASARAAGVRASSRPTYVVVGAPGAGKSEAMRAMGLNGGAEAAQPQDLSSCRLWLGHEATFVEAVGAAEDQAHRQAWQAFLDVLRRRLNPRRLVGICAVFDARTLMSGAPPADALAAVRAQLCSLEEAFGVRPPVYVLLTHLDELTGFDETFAALAGDARQQVLGFALQNAEPARVEERFHALTTSLWTHATMRLDAQMLLEARRPLFLFPHQFAGLGPGLRALVERVFAPVGFGQGPTLRGIYFTAVGAGARSHGRSAVAALLPPGASDREATHLFTGRLAHEVLRPDRARPTTVTRRGPIGLWRRQPVAVVACGTLAALTLVQVLAWRQGRRALAEASHALQAAQDGLVAGPLNVGGLRPLRTHLEAAWHGVGAEARVRSPLRTAPQRVVFEACARAYARALQQGALGGLFEADARALDVLWRTYALREDAPAPAAFAAATTQLKTHLLLTQPREAHEPGPGGEAGRWLALALAQRWVDLQALEPAPDEVNEMGRALALYARLLATIKGFGLPRQPALVDRTRAVLARRPLEDALVDNFLHHAARALPPLSVHDLLGSTTVPVRGRYAVPGALTHTGWTQLARPWLEMQATDSDAWVFRPATPAPAASRQLAQQLRSRYLARYIEAWQHLLDGLSVPAPTGAGAALATLEGLTRGEPLPYRRLFAGVAKHTRLASGAEEGGAMSRLAGSLLGTTRQRDGAAAMQRVSRERSSAAGLLGPSDVEAAFASWVAFGVAPNQPEGSTAAAALDAYHDQLIGVRNALQASLDDPREADAVLRRVRAAQQATHAAIEERELAVGMRPRLETLLSAPLAGIARDLAADARAQLDVNFCAQVAAPSAALLQRYPFARHGADAPLAEVADFFRPETGQLWRFYAAHLRHDVPTLGDTFAFDARHGGAISDAYRPALLGYLNRAQALTRALFAPGQNEPSASFDARILPSTADLEVTLRVDGQLLTMSRAEASWQRLSWPGPKRGQGAALSVRGGSDASDVLAREGEWGLLRLFEDGRIERRPGQQGFVVTWLLASEPEPVRLEVRPSRYGAPFFAPANQGAGGFLALFRDPKLHAPDQVTRRGRGCGISGKR